MTTASSATREEYVTIIATTAGAAMAQFKVRGLDAEGYAIAGPIGRHRFALVAEGGTEDLFSGTDLVAATFSRRVSG